MAATTNNTEMTFRERRAHYAKTLAKFGLEVETTRRPATYRQMARIKHTIENMRNDGVKVRALREMERAACEYRIFDIDEASRAISTLDNLDANAHELRESDYEAWADANRIR